MYLGGSLAPLGGGGGGAFLFLAEQTEHDSSEQLLPEDPDDDWKKNYLNYYIRSFFWHGTFCAFPSVKYIHALCNLSTLHFSRFSHPTRLSSF